MTDQDFMALGRAVQQIQNFVMQLAARIDSIDARISPDIQALAAMIGKISDTIDDPRLKYEISEIVRKRVDPNYRPNGLQRAADVVSNMDKVDEEIV
jgi:hypothetical protein